MPPSAKRPDLPGYYAGVPLGGIGAGCIEIGEDARFRNITINNNRTAASRIPLAPGAFAAVRAATRSGGAARILQPETSVAFDAAEIAPPYAEPEELAWYGLYPASNFRLDSPEFPLEVHWSCLSPIIPFETAASTLPLIFSIFQFSNPSEERYTVSAMINWENLRGCTSTEWPADRGRLARVCYDDVNEHLFTGDGPGANYEAVPAAPLGIAFAHGEPCTQNAHGDYCLISAPGSGNSVTMAGWNKDRPDDVRSVWTSFAESGTLPNLISTDPGSHCGAVCASATLAPRETRRFVFVFSWYCPVYRVAGADLGNAYTNELENSLAVAAQGIKHAGYFQRAVANWQQRLVKSSLPPWHSRMLLNSCHVFSTNTLYTKAGEFAMIESPQEPVTGALAKSLFSSFGTLLFYPSLAEKEIELIAQAVSSDGSGRPCRDLGQETVRQPSGPAAPGEMLDLNAALVLLAYRNFHLAGKTATLMNIFPKLRQAMEAGLKYDRDGDGLPEGRGPMGMFPGQELPGVNTYGAGLWIPAMMAFARLARHLKQAQDADAWEARAKKAIESFEQKLWNESAGCYRPRGANESCFTAQLAGPWVSDFMNLDVGFSHAHILRALDTIREKNGRESGLALGSDAGPEGRLDSGIEERWSWPMLASSCIAASQLRHGDAEDGMETLNALYRTIHTRAKRGFNQPLAWDLDRNIPAGPMQDRHMGALAVWHSLYALLGFWMSVPEQRIVIAPRFPNGVTHFEAPLFTPVAFGTLRYECAAPPGTSRRLRLSFDSPVFIKTIEVELARTTPAPYVTLLINDDPAPIRQQVLPGQPFSRLEIALQTPLQVQHPIEIRID
jgi:uncharacterized protein (DUF608 family)